MLTGLCFVVNGRRGKYITKDALQPAVNGRAQPDLTAVSSSTSALTRNRVYGCDQPVCVQCSDCGAPSAAEEEALMVALCVFSLFASRS